MLLSKNKKHHAFPQSPRPPPPRTTTPLPKHFAILGLQARDKAAILGVKTIEFFLGEFT